MARIIIGCESSGVVRRAFRARGHDAWSCDLLPAADGSPYHIQGDLLEALGRGGWDFGICHPPCTFLTNSAAWAFKDGPYHQRVKPGTLVGAARREARVKAIRFVSDIWESDVPALVVENPRGFLSSMWREPVQTIQPYHFGENASKATCLWIRGKGILPLQNTVYCEPRLVCSNVECGEVFAYGQHKCPFCGCHEFRPRWANQTDSGQNRLSPSEDRWSKRSETYPGIAEAMAEQWGRML